MTYYIGIDVGTGSARAGVFSAEGQLLASAKHDIQMQRPHSDWAQQNTRDIWQAVCFSVRHALEKSAVTGAEVAAIGFDATCSLALADGRGQPLDLGGGDDVLLWMDQRAVAQAQACNATHAEPLNYVGGRMSPEMQMPKLLWLKNHRPDLWSQMGYAWDLSDWLTWRATGNNARSVCTLTCKWGFMPHRDPSWDEDFLHAIDLQDVRERAALPDDSHPVGAAVGALHAEAAEALGLSTDCMVASGMIDAHAGALASFSAIDDEDFSRSLALVAGTSNCHMAMHRQAQMVPGVWGPYQGVVMPDWWLNEGGQTTSGALLAYLVDQLRGSDCFAPHPHDQVSEAIIDRLRRDGDPAPELHILPDFLGNRAPFAEPRYRGVISGLSFDQPEEYFLKHYWAAACGIAYGTRQIIEALNHADYSIKQMILTGGHAKSGLLLNLYADACQMDILLPDCAEPVLLGAAITAAAAHLGDLASACRRLRPQIIRHHYDPEHAGLHQRRYAAFQQLYQDYAQRWTCV